MQNLAVARADICAPGQLSACMLLLKTVFGVTPDNTPAVLLLPSPMFVLMVWCTGRPVPSVVFQESLKVVIDASSPSYAAKGDDQVGTC